MAKNARRRPRRQIIYDDPIPLPWQTNNEFGIRFHEEDEPDRENQAEPEWRDNNRDPFSRMELDITIVRIICQTLMR